MTERGPITKHSAFFRRDEVTGLYVLDSSFPFVGRDAVEKVRAAKEKAVRCRADGCRDTNCRVCHYNTNRVAKRWWVSLGNAYRALRVGKHEMVSGSELVVWTSRLLIDADVIALPDIGYIPELPDDAPDKAVHVYQGFTHLLACRLAFPYIGSDETPSINDIDTAPFAWTFVREWCGLRSNAHVKAGLSWLRDNGYLWMVAANAYTYRPTISGTKWTRLKSKVSLYRIGDGSIVVNPELKIRGWKT